MNEKLNENVVDDNGVAPKKKRTPKKPTLFEEETTEETAVESKEVLEENDEKPKGKVKVDEIKAAPTIKVNVAKKVVKKKKEEPVDLVDEVIKKTKLPVYEETLTAKAFMSIDEPKVEKKTNKSLKKIEEEDRLKKVYLMRLLNIVKVKD